jgi:hypothetical protein
MRKLTSIAILLAQTGSPRLGPYALTYVLPAGIESDSSKGCWHESLLNELWQSSLARLGGEVVIETSARELGAFQRARAVGCAIDLLRLILANCLGDMGLRTTSAWASSVGLAEL